MLHDKNLDEFGNFCLLVTVIRLDVVVSYGRRGGRGLKSDVSPEHGWQRLSGSGPWRRAGPALAGLTFPKRIWFPAKVRVTHAGVDREEAGVILICLSCSHGGPGQVRAGAGHLLRRGRCRVPAELVPLSQDTGSRCS